MSDHRFLLAVVTVPMTFVFATGAAAIDIGTSAEFRRQRFDSWGTSISWMGNELGGWSDGGRRDQLLDLMFDDVNHLGLTFVRYKVNAGQNPALGLIPRPGANMEGWIPTAPTSVSDVSTWEWDWDADATQRWFLDQALARGANRVEAFANSAPWWMTISRDATGAPNNGQANLSSAHHDEFAHYLGEVVEHFRDARGVRFQSLAPMNEPAAGWWTSPGNQEGMNVPRGAEQASLIRAVGEELRRRAVPIELVAPEETSVTDTLLSWLATGFDSDAKSYVAKINTHTYPFRGGSGENVSEQLRAAAAADGKEVFASEFGVSGNGQPLSGGIALANRITSDVRNLQTSGWTYWQAVENDNGSGWGLLIAPFGGREQFVMRRQYQVMRQFSAHLRPGATVLHTSDNETVAAYDGRQDTTTIVFTNDEASPDTNVYNLLDRSAAYTRVIRTSATESYQSIGGIAPSGSRLSVTGPGQSVTTVVIHHRPNLLINAEMDRGGRANGASSIQGWHVDGGGFYGFADNTGDGSGAGALWTDNEGNAGAAFQRGVGAAEVDLTGVAFEFSVDLMFQDAGPAFYNAETQLGIEFYGADDRTLVHESVGDFATLVAPNIGVDSRVATDSVFRTYRTGRFVAPPGTRYVRPVIRYGGVGSRGTDWVYFDNAYLQVTHPAASGMEWDAIGSGDWSVDSNWSHDALMERNRHVYFGESASQPATVTLAGDEAVATLTLFNTQPYHIDGDGTLRLDSDDAPPVIDVRRGEHAISVATVLAVDAVAQVLPETAVTFDGSLNLNGRTLTKLGAGELRLAAGFEMEGGRLRVYGTPEPTVALASAAVLDGELEVLLAPGDQPAIGDEYGLIGYVGLPAEFANVRLPELASGLAWSLRQDATQLTASVIESTLAGDFNRDGVVNAADYTVWRDSIGAAEQGVLGGNGDGDGRVSDGDYGLWRDRYGARSASLQELAGPVSALPEGSSLALVSIGAGLLQSLSIGRSKRCQPFDNPAPRTRTAVEINHR